MLTASSNIMLKLKDCFLSALFMTTQRADFQNMVFQGRLSVVG